MLKVKKLNSSAAGVPKLDFKAAYNEFAEAIIKYVLPALSVDDMDYRVQNVKGTEKDPRVLIEFLPVDSEMNTSKSASVLVAVSYSEIGLELAAKELREAEQRDWDL